MLTIALPVPIVVSHFQFFYQSNQVVKKLNKETLRLSFKKDSELNNEDEEKCTNKRQHDDATLSTSSSSQQARLLGKKHDNPNTTSASNSSINDTAPTTSHKYAQLKNITSINKLTKCFRTKQNDNDDT